VIHYYLIYLRGLPLLVTSPAAQSGATIRKIVIAAREGILAYEERPAPPRDWSAYDVAQTREIADTLDLTRHLVEEAERSLMNRTQRRARQRGRPPTPTTDIAKVLLMQTYFGVPNRVAEGLLRLFGEKLGISREFSYKTIERGYDRAAVNRLLDEVLALTNRPIEGLEKVFAPDGTGFPSSRKENYADHRAHQRSEGRDAGAWPDDLSPAPYRVPVFGAGMIGTKFKLYTAWRGSADPRMGELSHFAYLLARTKELHPQLKMVVGDGLYAGRPQCTLVAEAGAVPRFLPRRNVGLKRLGSKGWIPMLMDMIRDPQGWFGEYYQREAAETGFSMVKNRKGALRKRLGRRKETEAYLRIVQHNVTRLGQLQWIANILPWDGYGAG
jgi:transposase